ncbi:MAG: 2Fe-2S iron-sulfur cluster binding domain-containing protein, partial [Candidatus Eremiobacteraeota bacterium]|nr:2Fe-2S iron-sulfur cluster binding domain-containing protein [Candidatus Eremiobacteraeota bacterium]
MIEFRIRVASKGELHEFPCDRNERILHAGLRGGIELPYECASGTCGTCKATLVEGDTENAWDDAPARKYVKADKGEVLMCQSFPRSDCSLTVLKRVEPMALGRSAPQRARGHVRELRALAPGIVAFEVALERPMSFEAGQFVLLEVPEIAGARSYSMVNFARDARTLKFVVKRLPGGRVSEWLFGPRAGERRVEIFGPLGHATFHPALAKHLICVAGGSGIAGMMSILEHAAEDEYFDRHDGRVFFGIRSNGDAFFLHELAAFARRYERLRVTIVLSHEEPSPRVVADFPELVFDNGLVHEAAKRAFGGPAAPDSLA